jgi:fatty-acyl-CoA synthase
VLVAGGTVVLLERFSVDEFLEAVARHRCTAAHVVPTMLYDVLDAIDGRAPQLDTLEMIRYGASPIAVARLEQAIDVFGGHRLVQGYGQTEAPNTLCVLTPDEHVSGSPQLASVGVPFVGNEITVLNDDLGVVDQDSTGEICVRGPLVMDGYWDRPEERHNVFAGGWMHTGDLGRLDERGFLHIVGRKKDMIITGGFNVYPKEIEDVLSRHPAVAAVAVVGVPDPRWGEAIVAVVVRRPDHDVQDDELIQHVKREKGSVAAPKRIVFRATLPLTAVGKPDKQRLREALVLAETPSAPG